jgi:hypothetical protein
LVCQDEFVVNNPLDVKENVEHVLDRSRLFGGNAYRILVGWIILNRSYGNMMGWYGVD